GIIHVGRRHHDGYQQPQGINQDMAFASVDLLAAIAAALLTALGRLDRLAVNGAGAGSCGASGLGADQRAEGVEQSLPGAVAGPVLEVVVDRLPGREVMGQRPPAASLACVVEQGVDDLAQVGLARAPTPAWTREERL